VADVSQLSRSRRPKWHYVAVGVVLIVVAVALTVAWQILAAPESVGSRAVGPAWVVAYFFGSLLFLLLIAGLVLIVILLLREVRLNERQSNFVSAVTHELKTPVSSLKLYLDTLEYRDVNPDRRAEFYRTMRQDIERLNATINNVLSAAMYTDRPVAEPRPLDLARLARRAVELTLNRYQLPKEAIRYVGPAVLAHLRVRDHGIGMSRTHLPFIFTRFYRIGAEVRRSRVGTGLGLFIVRAIVKGHRGTITADSPGPDRGSTFTISLPGLLEPEAEAEGASEAARA
jgi:signal transduction histidine kinase